MKGKNFCSQCGKTFDSWACGPTHALIRSERGLTLKKSVDPKRSEAARSLSAGFNSFAGKSRWNNLSPEKRIEQTKKMREARWGKVSKEDRRKVGLRLVEDRKRAREKRGIL